MKEPIDYEDEKSVIRGIEDIAGQIDEELDRDSVDKKKLCKLRFEQLLRGLYLQNTSPNGIGS